MSVVRLLDRMDPVTRAVAQASAGDRLAGKLVEVVKPFLNKPLLPETEAHDSTMRQIAARVGLEMVREVRTDGWRGLVFGQEGLNHKHVELVPSKREVPWRLAWISWIKAGVIAPDRLVVLLQRPDGTLMTFRAAGAWLAGMLEPETSEGEWHE